MQPRPWPRVPEATVRAARAAAGTGEYPLAMRIRDELGELFSDEVKAQEVTPWTTDLQLHDPGLGLLRLHTENG